MNANNDAHVLTRLHARLVKQLEADAVLGDFHTALQAAAEIKAVAAAIRALSADLGEAVARAGDGDAVAWRTETPYGVGYLFADELIEAGACLEGKPPSPAESAEGECRCPQHGSWIAADDVKRLTRTIDVAINGEAGAAKQASLCDVTAQIVRMFTDAAPSQVSDAMVDSVRADIMQAAANAGHPQVVIQDEWVRDALEAAQPQPGRVEGMVKDAARYRFLKDAGIIRVFPVSSGLMSRGGTRILADTKDWLPGDFTYVIDGKTVDVDAAIDAALAKEPAP